MPVLQNIRARAKRRERTWSSPERAARRAIGPASAGVATYLLSDPETAVGTTALVVTLLLFSQRLVAHHEANSAFTRLVRLLYPAVAPLMAFVGLTFLKVTSVVAGLSATDVTTVCLLALLGAYLARTTMSFLGTPARVMRVLVIGSGHTAGALGDELTVGGHTGIEILGFVPADDAPDLSSSTPQLGVFGDLQRVIREHDVDLVLLSGEAPRMTVFEEIAGSCLGTGVRVLDLAAFYEQVFGHVPVAAINAAWFQHVMHPRFSSVTPASKRVLDVALSLLCLVAIAPLVAVLALLIKLADGGPVLFRQVRIGEGGEPFEMLKLRSMSLAPADAAHHWTTHDDARVTRIGRLIRKTHLDEAPQLVNILKGEMSIVGPRPEQPTYVERLERFIPHYSRRHVVRPGLTGWAQVNCGYAGSDDGSTWKLCHDLYYLKHRSMGLDLLILAETVRTLVADRQFREPVPVHRFVRTESHGLPSKDLVVA